MQVVYARCAGLDVHKKTVSACISVCEAEGAKQQQMRHLSRKLCLKGIMPRSRNVIETWR